MFTTNYVELIFKLFKLLQNESDIALSQHLPLRLFLVVSLRNTDGTVIQGANSPKPLDPSLNTSFVNESRQRVLHVVFHAQSRITCQ
jgi:hypothetical protein